MMGENSNHILTRREKAVGWIPGILFLVIYLAFPNIENPNGDAVGWGQYLDLYASADGTPFYVTERPEPGSRLQYLPTEKFQNLSELLKDPGWWILWNPHHLLYVPVTAAIFRVVHHVFPGLEGIGFLRIWNAFASAAILILLCFLLVRLIPGSPYVIPWIILLATSPTFFHYATDGTQYMTALLFLSAGSGSIFAFARLGKSGYLLKSGIWFALAILFHQIAALIVPFLLIASMFVVSRKEKAGKGNFGKAFLGAAIIAIGIPVFVYLVVAAMALGPTGEFNLRGLFTYATLYAHQQRYWTNSIPDGFATNLLTMVGFYFGKEMTFRYFFVRIWFTVLVMVLPTLWLTTAIRARTLHPFTKWWLGICLLWLIPLEIFLSFWNPGHEFYQLFAVVPICVISLVGAESVRTKGRRGLVDVILFWIWCGIVVMVNVFQLE